MARTVKLSTENKGKKVKVGGELYDVDDVLVSKEHIRVQTNPSEFTDFHLDDIEEATGLIINITK